MDDLVAWLRAQIAASDTNVHRRNCATSLGTAIVYGEPAACNCGQPDAVLAQCEAHTAILEEALVVVDNGNINEPTLRALALAYQHRPGYRKQWAPER